MKKIYSLFLTLLTVFSVFAETQEFGKNMTIPNLATSSSGKELSSPVKWTSNDLDVELSFLQCYKAASSAYLMTVKGKAEISFTSSKTISKISITTPSSGTLSGNGTLALYIGEGTDYDAYNVCKENGKTYDFVPKTAPIAANTKITLKNINNPEAGTKNGNVQVASLTITFAEADSRQESGLAYSAEKYEVTVGQEYTLPTLANPNNLTVVYESSNTKAATISETGVVTIPETGVGETTISATFTGNDTYKPGNASYVLTVKNPNVPGYSAENAFTVAAAKAACPATGSLDGIYVKGIITKVTFFNSNFGSLTYYIADEAGSDDDLQVYGGLNIGGEKFTGMDDLAVGASVIVTGNIKMFKGAPEIDLNSEIVKYEAPEIITVAVPTFSVKSGAVEKGTEVSIACATEGATIRYAVGPNADDLDEDAVDGWDVYESPIAITEAVTIKAIAMKDGCNNSSVAVAAYTIKVPADATFNFAKPATLTPAYPATKDGEDLEPDGKDGNMQAVVNGVEFTVGNVSVSSTNTAEKGTPAKIYYQAKGDIQLRAYNGGSTTVKSTDVDNNITKIVFTYNNGSTSANNVTAPEVGTWDKTTHTWTGSAQEVVFNYKGSVQILTIEVFCAEGLTSGVDDVTVDNEDNAPVEYYNLQGVRVENPAAGQLYIKRQGSKATKVIVR